MSNTGMYRVLFQITLSVILFCLLQIVLTTTLVAQERVELQNDSPDFFWKVTPAGKLLRDATTNQIAVGSLPVDFIRSPDNFGKDGKGRYLLAINSGYGVQTDSSSNPGQQSIAVIDLNNEPEPQVIQNVYFPSPQSVNVGARFHPVMEKDGTYRLFVSGGFENKIWYFKFTPNTTKPITPASEGKDPEGKVTKITAPFIDVSAFATNAPNPNYNGNVAAVYPTGIALTPDGNTLFVANNLDDSLGIINDLRDTREISRIKLRSPNSKQFIYPYDVEILPSKNGKNAVKIYVSLWGDGTVAVVDTVRQNKVSYLKVDRHPTAMILNKTKTKLFVVNSDGESVSVIETATDRVIDRIDLKLSEKSLKGSSPEGLVLSEDEKSLFVANAKSNSVAWVSLEGKIRLKGFIPTGYYASAIAVVGNKIFVGNGKGTGVENSSLIVNNSGFYPNLPNYLFPPTRTGQGGQYSGSIVSGNISLITMPDETELFRQTQQVMRNNGLLGERKRTLFKGVSPIKHIIYVIRENRTYDQVFGDLEGSGDGKKADGDPTLAIFGAGERAKSPSGKPQNITPNVRSLALRFGLLDRFFVNAEASPDGHNWSTAAFSNDYVDKAFRWDYSGRGRTYDYEGFNRLPSYEPPANQPPVSLPQVFSTPATEKDITDYLKRYVPYLNGARDIAEPESLYLWDAAAKAGLTYRNYGEFVATVSENDVKELNDRKAKKYPDLSPNKAAFATKKSLEGNFSLTHRNYDTKTPDSMTIDSYKAHKENQQIDPLITTDNPDERFRGNSRFGSWRDEFRAYTASLKAGKGDKLPNLSIVRLSNDHTAGWSSGTPTPQFYVAENDFALGKLVEEVSHTPYWKDTAIFVVEDDAQAGPDHFDAHRSPAFVISAYNRKGALIHDFHNTVSLIRTIEILLGIKPMNLLDAAAVPIDIFQETPDLTPFNAILPEIALDNLTPAPRQNAQMQILMDLTAKQDLAHADMADPEELNEIIWKSVCGFESELPGIAKHPAFELMSAGLLEENENEEGETED